MPLAPTFPASGTNVIASAQVLARNVFILRGPIGPFGQPSAPSPPASRAQALRSQTRLVVNNLPKITVGLFLYPEYSEGGILFQPRTDITWRVVGRTPSVSVADALESVTQEWFPLTAPLILPVGLPISLDILTAGSREIAVEIVAPSGGQGIINKEQLVITMSGSQ